MENKKPMRRSSILKRRSRSVSPARSPTINLTKKLTRRISFSERNAVREFDKINNQWVRSYEQPTERIEFEAQCPVSKTLQREQELEAQLRAMEDEMLNSTPDDERKLLEHRASVIQIRSKQVDYDVQQSAMNLSISPNYMPHSLSFELTNMNDMLESTTTTNGKPITATPFIFNETLSSIDSNSPKDMKNEPNPLTVKSYRRNVTCAQSEDIETTLVLPSGGLESMCLSTINRGPTEQQGQTKNGSDMDISSVMDTSRSNHTKVNQKTNAIITPKPVVAKSAPPLIRSVLNRAALKERSNVQLSSAIQFTEKTVRYEFDMECSKMDSFLMNERECMSINLTPKSKTIVGNKTIDETVFDNTNIIEMDLEEPLSAPKLSLADCVVVPSLKPPPIQLFKSKKTSNVDQKSSKDKTPTRMTICGNESLDVSLPGDPSTKSTQHIQKTTTEGSAFNQTLREMKKNQPNKSQTTRISHDIECNDRPIEPKKCVQKSTIRETIYETESMDVSISCTLADSPLENIPKQSACVNTTNRTSCLQQNTKNRLTIVANEDMECSGKVVELAMQLNRPSKRATLYDKEPMDESFSCTFSDSPLENFQKHSICISTINQTSCLQQNTGKNRLTIVANEDMECSDKVVEPALQPNRPSKRATVYDKQPMDESGFNIVIDVAKENLQMPQVAADVNEKAWSSVKRTPFESTADAIPKKRQTIIVNEDMDCSDKVVEPALQLNRPSKRATVYDKQPMDESRFHIAVDDLKENLQMSHVVTDAKKKTWSPLKRISFENTAGAIPKKRQTIIVNEDMECSDKVVEPTMQAYRSTKRATTYDRQPMDESDFDIAIDDVKENLQIPQVAADAKEKAWSSAKRPPFENTAGAIPKKRQTIIVNEDMDCSNRVMEASIFEKKSTKITTYESQCIDEMTTAHSSEIKINKHYESTVYKDTAIDVSISEPQKISFSVKHKTSDVQLETMRDRAHLTISTSDIMESTFTQIETLESKEKRQTRRTVHQVAPMTLSPVIDVNPLENSEGFQFNGRSIHKTAYLTMDAMESSGTVMDTETPHVKPCNRMTIYDNQPMDESMPADSLMPRLTKDKNVYRSVRSCEKSLCDETPPVEMTMNESRAEPSLDGHYDATSKLFRRRSSVTSLRPAYESFKKLVDLTGIKALDPEDIEDIENINASRIMNFETTFISEEEEREKHNKEEALEKRKAQALKAVDKYNLPIGRDIFLPSSTTGSTNVSVHSSLSMHERIQSAGESNASSNESFFRRKRQLKPEDISIDLSGYAQFEDVVFPEEACEFISEHFKKQKLREKQRTIDKAMAKLDDPRSQNLSIPKLSFLIENKRAMQREQIDQELAELTMQKPLGAPFPECPEIYFMLENKLESSEHWNYTKDDYYYLLSGYIIVSHKKFPYVQLIMQFPKTPKDIRAQYEQHNTVLFERVYYNLDMSLMCHARPLDKLVIRALKFVMPEDLKLIGSNIYAISTIEDFVHSKLTAVLRDVTILFMATLQKGHFITNQYCLKMFSKQGPYQEILIHLDNIYTTGLRDLRTEPPQLYREEIYNLTDGLQFLLRILSFPSRYLQLPDGVVF